MRRYTLNISDKEFVLDVQELAADRFEVVVGGETYEVSLGSDESLAEAVITPELGEKFDPQRHEAMFEAPVPGTIAGSIIQVMDNGFMLHDRLLRPAKVGVSSMPAS